MTPTHLRGRLGVANNFFAGTGLLTGIIVAGLYSLDTKFAYTYGWRFDYCIRKCITTTALSISNRKIKYIIARQLLGVALHWRDKMLVKSQVVMYYHPYRVG